jgi:hypothetical protein
MHKFQVMLLAALCLGGAPIWGQTEIGGASLNGVVTDPSSAVITGAKVTAKSPSTGLERTTETGDSGLYVLRLPVGTYEITVERAGFRKAEIKLVQLTVGSAVTLDVPMQVGGATESVEVSADAQAVESTQSTTSTNVSARAVADLPVNGRNFIDFTTLTPGVVRDPTRGGDLSFGGQRGPSNSLLVDGADSNNLFSRKRPGAQDSAPTRLARTPSRHFRSMPTRSPRK